MKSFLGLILLFNFSLAQAQSCKTLFARTKTTAQILRQEKIITVDGLDRKVQVFSSSLNPKNNYRVLIYFHGTNSIVNLDHPVTADYGTYHESQFIKDLVQKGFVVIAPESNSLAGFIPYTFIPTSYKAWEANIYPYSENFENSRDARLVEALFLNLKDLSNSPTPPAQIFVGGFSSGGYMASRIGNIEALAGQIDGLIINAASYGTCLAAKCSIPQNIPPWHPKTILLSNQDDSIVPFKTVDSYAQILQKNQIPVQTIYHLEGDHSWLETQVKPLIKWLDQTP